MLALAASAIAYLITKRSGSTGSEVTTASGLKYTDIVEGTGPSPTTGQTLSVHYTGTLQNGTKFDSSRDRGTPMQFRFGLDPMIVSHTFEEASKCRKSGILINTFMLASDYDLIAFVKKLTQMCRGKAYFTSPYNLGEYILFDYLNRKTQTKYKQ